MHSGPERWVWADVVVLYGKITCHVPTCSLKKEKWTWESTWALCLIKHDGRVKRERKMTGRKNVKS